MVPKEINIPAFLNPQSIKDLTEQLLIAEKENTRFIILKGSHTTFCNGLDLKWVTQNNSDSYQDNMQTYADFLKKLQTGSFICVAIVSGAASGGGMGIVCAADYVIATEASSFSLPEGLLGLIPGMIMPALLNRLTPQQIKKMVFSGGKHVAKEALAMGIADEIVAATDIDTSLIKVVNTFKNCKKDPVADIKQLLYNNHYGKDQLAKAGMNILIARLKDTEIKERLQNLAEFLED